MKKILIVDDDPEAVSEFMYALERHNFKVDYAFNGFDAYRKIYNNKPDLVLLDFLMPGMDGFKVCERLCEDKKVIDLPIIAITVLKSEEDVNKIKECGVVSYMAKPVDVPKLMGLISDILGKDTDKRE